MAKDLRKTKGRSLSTEVNELQSLLRERLRITNKMIVAFLGKSVKEYLDDFVRFLADLTFICTVCQGECICHAWCERKARTGDEASAILTILRVKCLSCLRTHIVLPDFLRPYGRYTQQIREATIRVCLEGASAEKATVHGQAVETSRRWVAQFKADVEKAIAFLRSLLAQWGRFPPPTRGSPISSLARLCQAAADAFGAGLMSSCFFGQANILLTQIGLPVWL